MMRSVFAGFVVAAAVAVPGAVRVAVGAAVVSARAGLAIHRPDAIAIVTAANALQDRGLAATLVARFMLRVIVLRRPRR
jgi:hypothetical protein